MAPFLEFSGAAGNILHARLPQSEPFASCFLPDQVEDNINLSPFRICKSHSAVRLQIYAGHLLLSVWDDEAGPVFVLNYDGACTEVPTSTQSREILFMLTNRCQFFSPASRWKIDLYHNEVTSGSMKPPPLPHCTINPRDLICEESKMLAKEEDDEEDGGLQNIDLSFIEDFAASDGADESVVPTASCTSTSTASGKGEQVQDPQNPSIAVESRINLSPKQATNSDASNIAVMYRIPATPQRKKLVDMEDHEDIEPQVATPRPRKKVRFNPNVNKQSPIVFADLPDEHLCASPLQAKQDIFRRKPGEESQELRAPKNDTQKETDSADARDTNARNDQSKAVDRRYTVWPFCSFRGALPNRPEVVFSSNCTVQTRRKTMSTFAQLGGEVVDDVDHADILCIPEGPIKRTTKFVLAIALGKVVVVEDWIVQSSRRQELQSIDKFIPKDKIREQQWNFSVLEAMKRSTLENGKILKDWKLYVTPQLRKELGGIMTHFEKIAKALGALELQRGLPTKQADPESSLILGDENDADIKKVKQMGFNVHRKDALVLAALRGYHDAKSNEFML